MGELKIFDNDEFGRIRMVMIDGEPWFVGKDVATALGYDDTVNALKKHVNAEDKIMGCQNATPSITDSMGRIQYPTWINESGLYSLIFGSKLESAKRFKHWVTSEILPSIRKTGSYGALNETIQQFMEQQMEFNKMVAANLGEKSKRVFHKRFTLSLDILKEREKEVGMLVNKIAICREKTSDRILHLLYRKIEEHENILLDAFKMVYIAESGDVSASMLRALVAYDDLYELAVELCEEKLESCMFF